ncbi:hypothetical protein [Heyndrickxia coagulans]|jgi:hypothetical protein|uniref:hypothetical protein n=1 Tax=Heyndrickxia coagulans TaxID=1398 RepID=UPI001C52F183|nr:hypothetical protein [Heyndrickxia coagulans]WNE61303.1 hypothetical protein KIY57_15720 [Heyndrickxia coagulans]
MAVFSKAGNLHTRFPFFCQSALSGGRMLPIRDGTDFKNRDCFRFFTKMVVAKNPG